MFTHINEYLNRVGYLFTYFIFISTNDVKLYIRQYRAYTYTRMPPRHADHPQDERLHHTITRTDERFDLWRFIRQAEG